MKNFYLQTCKLRGDELLSEGDGLMSATNKNKINSFIFYPETKLSLSKVNDFK